MADANANANAAATPNAENPQDLNLFVRRDDREETKSAGGEDATAEGEKSKRARSTQS